MQQIISTLRSKLASLQQKVETKPNGFLRLPPPVLIRITVFLELRYRLSLAFTFAKAKSALFSAPQLWNRAHASLRLNTPKESVPRVLTSLMRLAQASHFYPTLPLHYRVTIQGASLLVAGDPRRVLYTCQSAFREATSITLTVLGRRYPSTGTSQQWSHFCSSILALPNPRLEALSVCTVEPRTSPADWSGWCLPSDMLDSDPGALTTLSLRGISLLGVLGEASPPIIPALSNLRTLNYVTMNRPLGELELRFLLTLSPGLENIGLGFQAFEPQPASSDASLPANRIRRVGFTGFSGGSLELLRLFHHAASIRAIFSDAYSGQSRHFAHWIDCDDVHVQIRVESMMVVGRNRERDFEFYSSWKHVETSLSPLFVIADRISCISIREQCWEGAIEILPDMVSLKDLRILLMTCGETRRSSRNVQNIFTWSPVEGQGTAKFPALESLRFLAGDLHGPARCPALYIGSRCSCDNGCTLSLRDIMSFIHRILLPGQRIRLLAVPQNYSRGGHRPRQRGSRFLPDC